MKWLWIALVVVALAVAGCISGIDPVTGEKTIALDPNVPAVVEPIVAAGAGIANLFGPVGALVGGILLGILGAWQKVKPSLVAAKSEALQSHAAAAAVIEGIEEFKKLDPASWSKLGGFIGDKLSQQGIDPKIVENVIRAIRGLPAKG